MTQPGHEVEVTSIRCHISCWQATKVCFCDICTTLQINFPVVFQEYLRKQGFSRSFQYSGRAQVNFQYIPVFPGVSAYPDHHLGHDTIRITIRGSRYDTYHDTVLHATEAEEWIIYVTNSASMGLHYSLTFVERHLILGIPCISNIRW